MKNRVIGKISLLFVLQIVAFLIGVGAILVTFQFPKLQYRIYPLEKYGAALSLLKTYHIWYILILVAAIFCFLFFIISNLVLILLIRRQAPALRNTAITLFVVLLGLVALVTFVMVMDTNLIRLIPEAKADIQQLEQGELSTFTGIVSDRTYKGSMPGPYSSDIDYDITDISLLNPHEQGAWTEFLLPNQVLDPTELNRSTDGGLNRDQLQEYTITYTDHFRLIVTIEEA